MPKKIYGTVFDNHLVGSDEDEELYGFGGNDLIEGGGGDDTLNGGTGSDTMIGGTGSDTYYVDNARGDVVIEEARGGTDTVITSAYNYYLPDHVENLTLEAGTGAVQGHGNELDNLIHGNENDNILWGNGGDNRIHGGAGADAMYGGLGDDQFWVDDVNDVVTEYAKEGHDTIYTSVNYALTANVEDLVLLDYGNAVIGIGNDLDNKLTGNIANNTLIGDGGQDWLDGLLGADTMIGGEGDDTYVVDDFGDMVLEAEGEGLDTVFTSSSCSIENSAVENVLLFLGFDAIEVIGNDLDNYFGGNDSSNIFYGGGGKDVLVGAGGIDTMYGGTGTDEYYVDDAGDIIVEYAGEGIDWVKTTASYVLPDHVENAGLLSWGGGGLNLTGNTLDNILSGDQGSNILTGGGGNDTFQLFNIVGYTEFDTITDFVAGDASGDVIQMHGYNLVGGFAELLPYLSQVGNDVFGNFDTFNGLTLKNVQLSDLNANDFQFY